MHAALATIANAAEQQAVEDYLRPRSQYIIQTISFLLNTQFTR